MQDDYIQYIQDRKARQLISSTQQSTSTGTKYFGLNQRRSLLKKTWNLPPKWVSSRKRESGATSC